MKKGILFCVGTGPGDAGLITVQALNTIKKCDVIVLPAKSREQCTAYSIVKAAMPEIVLHEVICLDLPMVKDADTLQKAQHNAADRIEQQLVAGKNAAFINIGDPTIYATCMYIKFIIDERGFETVVINGIPSFCAVAARLGISLSEQDEEIHIIPSSYDISASFEMKGTLVFMKSGKKMLQLKEFLMTKKETHNFEFYAVSNCGMQDERILTMDDLSGDTSYFTIVIIKHIEKKAAEKNYNFFQHRECEMFPCHKGVEKEDFNCLFCYCPLYLLGDACGGNFKYTEKGVKSCADCSFPHRKENYEKLVARLKELK